MKRVVVFIVLAMVVIGSCAAQSASNDAQRLVGTWVSEDGHWTLVLNANGTGTSRGENTFWGFSGSGGLRTTRDGGEGHVFMSPDGRRMIWRGTAFQKR